MAPVTWVGQWVVCPGQALPDHSSVPEKSTACSSATCFCISENSKRASTGLYWGPSGCESRDSSRCGSKGACVPLCVCGGVGGYHRQTLAVGWEELPVPAGGQHPKVALSLTPSTSAAFSLLASLPALFHLATSLGELSSTASQTPTQRVVSFCRGGWSLTKQYGNLISSLLSFPGTVWIIFEYPWIPGRRS